MEVPTGLNSHIELKKLAPLLLFLSQETCDLFCQEFQSVNNMENKIFFILVNRSRLFSDIFNLLGKSFSLAPIGA